jgi:hypothetical protein
MVDFYRETFPQLLNETKFAYTILKVLRVQDLTQQSIDFVTFFLVINS